MACSQCGTTFSPDPDTPETAKSISHWHYVEQAFVRPPWPMIAKSENRSEADQPGDLQAPVAPQRRIGPWLLIATLLILTAGIWSQKSAWLDNRWLRSTLMNLSIPLEHREKDWKIIPESVHAKWQSREDKSRVLVISGVIKNLLETAQPYPEIELTYFANHQPDLVLGNIRLPITEKTAAQNRTDAAALLPARRGKAASLAESEFTLIIEALPEGIGDFTLTPRY